MAIDVEVYAPYGTSKHQLGEDFLGAPSQMSLEGKGRKHEKMNPDWVTLIEVLRELEHQPYATPVGRTIFQKICYVITEMGVNTGFEFKKGSYGPFSDDIKLALHDFANRNWLQEAQLGRMLTLRVGEQYERDRPKFEHQIKHHQKRISKVVDLFSRIKSTDQAEEVLTVLYASRQLKQAGAGESIEEQDLFKFILGWKKSWNNDEKKGSLDQRDSKFGDSGWMRAKISDDTEEESRELSVA